MAFQPEKGPRKTIKPFIAAMLFVFKQPAISPDQAFSWAEAFMTRAEQEVGPFDEWT